MENQNSSIMFKADHATIQFLADEGYLVLFLNNVSSETDTRWKDYQYVNLINRAFYWTNTYKGHNFWEELCMNSLHFYSS